MTTANEQQRALYGAPLGELVGQVRDRLGLTQTQVAEVLGLSAPMLSQLVSGHRVKIGNPAVVHRLQALLVLAASDPLPPREVLDARLAAIHAERSTLSGEHSPAVTELRSAAPVEVLVRLAEACPDAPLLQDLLRRAARG